MPSLRTGLLAASAPPAVAALAGGVYGMLTPEPAPGPGEPPRPPDGGPMLTPFLIPARTQPPTVPAAEAALPDDEPVVGVVAGGRARAYRVRALTGSMNQVVNDVVGGVSVTVTRCSQTSRTRVFTGPGDFPLPVMTGGYADGLVLRVGNGYYRQRDGRPFRGSDGIPFPYTDLDFVEGRWAARRMAHPDTDVYVGEAAPRPPAGKAN
jgi:Protein of unknown function (DUF3179)